MCIPSPAPRTPPPPHPPSFTTLSHLFTPPDTHLAVPDRFRSYGYDEGPDGKLVPQRPSNIRTVVGIDRPGPTDYDPNPALMRRGESATEFGKVRG